LVVRVCGSEAGSRDRGRKFPVAARKIPKRHDGVGDGAGVRRGNPGVE
jgi:hypothetical protein